MANNSRVCREFSDLKTKCKTGTGDTYIQSLRLGANISPENLSKGFTHVCFLSDSSNWEAFVVDFITRADRDWYLQEDPAHIAFTKNISVVEDILVIDFED
jgi:hypothetical protein